MRHIAYRVRPRGFTVLESLLMIGLISILGLMSWAIYLKETDPEKKGAGVWERAETPFVPAFQEVEVPLIEVPDATGTPAKDPLTDLLPDDVSIPEN